MQTPLVYGPYLYNCRDNGVMSVYDAKTGDRKYQQRLGRGGGGFTASPVAADGKVYFTSEEGDVYVIEAGPEYEHLGTNQVPGVCLASPAISEGTFFVRSSTHVWALAETEDKRVFEAGAETATEPEANQESGRCR